MTISHDDIRNLLRLFDASDWTEMRLEVDGLKLVVSNDPNYSAAPAAAPAAVPATAPAAAPATAPAPGSAAPQAGAPVAAAVELKDGQIAVKAPNLGTFWQQPKPGAPPYVQVGDLVDETTTVCLIEVMKLFTPVKAQARGRVAAICVADGTMVEFDTVLLVLDPV
ncbi:MAG: biotin/lipoyl-containing protein [Sneathiellaceae bacterium]